MQQELNQARAVVYGTLSLLFVYQAASKKPEDLLNFLQALEESGYDDAACDAAKELRTRLQQSGGFEELDEEFSDLFLLPFGNGVAMTASVYQDEREAGEPLLRVKEVLNLTGLRREVGNFSDNEDNFGFVLTLMANLTREASLTEEMGAFIASGDLYRNVLKPFSPAFVGAIMTNGRASLYRLAAVMLDRFMAFEEHFYGSLALTNTAKGEVHASTRLG